MYIAIDFDGTCVKHDYPNIGEDIGATPVLKKIVERGHSLILNTMRSGKELNDAINWFSEREIPLFGINVNPTQKGWTTSPKVYAHLYIDDCALGAPCIFDMKTKREYIDWTKVEILLQGLI